MNFIKDVFKDGSLVDKFSLVSWFIVILLDIIFPIYFILGVDNFVIKIISIICLIIISIIIGMIIGLIIWVWGD